MAVVSPQMLLLISAMLSTAGSLKLPTDTLNLELERDTGTVNTGLSFEGEPIGFGRINDKLSAMGNESYMTIGRDISAVYAIADEPFGYDMSSRKNLAIEGEEQLKGCSDNSRAELAAKHTRQDIPRGTAKSALPEGSFYGKLAASAQTTIGCEGQTCKVPTYLPAREEAAPQKIPRIIWMTIPNKMANAGPFQYNLLAEHFLGNPEYEFVASNDDQSAEFMASDEVKPRWAEAYRTARNGAEKADLWRYAVMYKYGGVYMDSDMKALKKLRDIVDSSADVMQQVTPKQKKGKAELSQFALLFTPGHKLMEEVLDAAVHRMQANAQSNTREPTISVTGPGAMNRAFARHPEFGLQACADHYHICGEAISINSENALGYEKFGKVKFLTGGRDLDTGVKWHKADLCALAECRSSVGRWEDKSAAAGGKR